MNAVDYTSALHQLLSYPFPSPGVVREVHNRATKPLVHSLRNLFEETNTYEEAKAFLESTLHLSPAYFILGGLDGNDAAIITSGGISAVTPINRPNTTLAETSQAGTPWLLQTNSDHDNVKGDRFLVLFNVYIVSKYHVF